jgi:hypothetical protein
MIPSCICTHLKTEHPGGGCMHLWCACEQFNDATSEHTAFLRDLAETGLAIARRDLERTGSVMPFFVLRDQNGNSHQLNVPEKFKELMNHGPSKDKLFGFVRNIAQTMPAAAVVIVTDGWFGKPTAKARAMNQEKLFEATKGQSLDNAVAAGLAERLEALLITVQTPERVLTLAQVYDRDERRRKITYLEMNIMESPIDNFAGRQKMFGDLRAENLR